MEAEIITIPNVIELSLLSDERKEAILTGMFAKYVEKINELSKYASDDVITVANENADVIATEIEEKDYLSLFPWKLYKFYEEVRTQYNELVLLNNRYKRMNESQDRYHREIEEKLITISNLEHYILEHKEICKHFPDTTGFLTSEKKEMLLARKYNRDSCDYVVNQCNEQIKDYLDIIYAFKEEESDKKVTGIDAVIADAKSEGQQEKEEAKNNIADGLDMFSQLQAIRNLGNS